MAGIRDIAKKAGVSISTVSYALNGSSKVTEETRAKIMHIAMGLNYVPNLAGRTLKKQSTNIIAMYVADFGGDFYSHVIDGVDQVLRANHYELIVGAGGDKSRALIPQKFVDGAVILDQAFPDRLIKSFAKQGSKMVVMDRELSGTNVHKVLLDNAKGAKQAIDTLVAANVDYYVFISGPSDSYDSQVRLQTALASLSDKTDAPVIVIPSDFTIDGGRKAAKKISNAHLKNVGVFALNDELAIGLYEALPELGYAVGKDIKIIGFDNDLIGHYLTPQLTTIDYSKHKWGETAAQTLIDMIKDNGQAGNHYIETKVIQRGSLGEEKVNHDQDRLSHF
ncbi:MAG: LacI family transcriptional regulator [Schleiferilactobacillus harbinensis]|nr:LacI family transcriptional regulator [Schleiferilactobacillus harbinensis]MCI1911404.1 LacI family transcriptional regulator [Schleiferilactobacillus harbinensis]